MSSQESYNRSREICDSINSLMGIEGVEFRRKDIGTLYFSLLKDVMVHSAAEKALESDSRVKETKILIPFIGDINISFENNNVEVKSFDIDRGFKKQIKKALTTGESPIDTRLCKSVVRRILENYRDLL